jgi:phosphoribosyl 1,2-cyclic phosphodiesterase
LFYFRSLASGSSGNAFLLKTPEVCLLFDAGLRLATLRRYLGGEGLQAGDLSAILLSHEHGDHAMGVDELIGVESVPVWTAEGTAMAMGLGDNPNTHRLQEDGSQSFADVEVRTFPVPHDAARPVGFLIRVDGRVIVIATDLGRATRAVAAAIAEANLVVLESNHDAHMLRSGPYPFGLRQRVAGPYGHLSNHQAGALLAASLRERRAEVWLAHLSRENNTRRLAVDTVRAAMKATGLRSVHLNVAGRDRPSLRWNGEGPPRQLGLFERAAS